MKAVIVITFALLCSAADNAQNAGDSLSFRSSSIEQPSVIEDTSTVTTSEFVRVDSRYEAFVLEVGVIF